MKICYFFLLGMFVAGVVTGAWWMIVIFGVVSLLFQRSYFVVVTGLLLDLVFAVTGDAIFYGGFYLGLFLITTLLIEYVRNRLFWSS